MVTVLWTGSDRFGYVVSTSLHGLPPNFTHVLKICLGRFLSPFRSARLIGKAGFRKPTGRDHVAMVAAGSCETAKVL